MYTTAKRWIIDGNHIVSIEEEKCDSIVETICDFIPETEYPTVHERSITETFENAKLICKAPKMFEAIKEVLELFDGNGIPNIEFIKTRLAESIS